jgi:lipopolysaccharide transport system permease protein
VEQLTATAPKGQGAPERPTDLDTVRLEPTRGLFGRLISPRELWRYRDLALQIAARDITVRYRQTALGIAWTVLQPLGFMVVFSLFFGNLAGISSNGIPYPLFSLAALVPWTYFSNALLLGSDSLVANSALISKIYFPRIFIPAGVVAAGLVDLGISILILFVVVLIWGLTPSAGVLMLPLLVTMAVAAALGVSSALSAVNVRYRDVRYVVPFAVQLWLFATPVAYPVTLLDEPWRTLSAINPMVGVVEGFRWAALGETSAPWLLIGISAASAAILLVGGLAYFHRVERDFADVV